MTLEQVIDKLKSEYERAKSLEYVRKPLAFALYQVWREVDKKPRETTDLSFKCGSCKYAISSNSFGDSNCYVECTNKDHLIQYCHRHDISKVRQRTNKACRRYEPKEKV